MLKLGIDSQPDLQPSGLADVQERMFLKLGSPRTPRWRQADSNCWSHLERDQPFRACHAGFRARRYRMRLIPERKVWAPGMRDNLGSRSCGRLSHPILRMKRQKTGTWDGRAEREDGAGHRVDRRGRPARRSQIRAGVKPGADWPFRGGYGSPLSERL